MKNKFCTIILAANFVTSTALFCAKEAAPAPTPAPAAVAAPVAKPGLLSQAGNFIYDALNFKSHWANHPRLVLGGGAVAAVSALVAAHKRGLLPKCMKMGSFCNKKDKSS